MKFRLIAIFLLIACVFAACDSPTQNGRRRRSASLLTPVSSGNPYEVMVVAGLNAMLCSATFFASILARNIQRRR